MNKVILTGRLTKDVELKYTSGSQTAVVRFSIALDRGKDKNGEDRGADFPTVIAFGKTAENLERFSGKGLRVTVDGHLQTGSYEDKNGNKVFTTDVVADRLEFIDWKSRELKVAEDQTGVPSGFAALAEEIPF